MALPEIQHPRACNMLQECCYSMGRNDITGPTSDHMILNIIHPQPITAFITMPPRRDLRQWHLASEPLALSDISG